LPEARPPWSSPQGSAAAYRPIFNIHPAASRARPQGTRTLRPPAKVELGAAGGGRCYRCRHRAKPGTPIVRISELWRAISACPARLSHGQKPASSLRIGFRTFERIWWRLFRFSAMFQICRDDRICRQGECQNTGRERDSLITAETSLIARFALLNYWLNFRGILCFSAKGRSAPLSRRQRWDFRPSRARARFY
jgi:hypothetical protein